MKVEVLLSVMNQTDFSAINACNISGDAVVVNQCEKDKIEVIYNSGGSRITWIDSTERGLSRSRNTALAHASADVCLLCDDDVVYYGNYQEIVKRAFKEVPDADVLIFDIDEIGTNEQRKKANKISRVPFFKTFGSVHIAIRRNVFQRNNIRFNECFGAGSGMYSMAEDSLLFREFHRNKMKVYRYPATISKVLFGRSSWFYGFDEKYFYDTGAYLAAAYPEFYHVMKWYYPLRLFHRTNLSAVQMIKYINLGVDGYFKKIPYHMIKGRENGK